MKCLLHSFDVVGHCENILSVEFPGRVCACVKGRVFYSPLELPVKRSAVIRLVYISYAVECVSVTVACVTPQQFGVKLIADCDGACAAAFALVDVERVRADRSHGEAK